MPEQKKTEEQIRHDIRRKFNFSEEKDKERIDKAVEMEKDRFKAVGKKLELETELKKTGEPVGKDPVGEKRKYSLDEIDEISALSGIPREDREWVVKVAEAEGKKPSEVLGLGYVKIYLKEKAEERATAQATNTKKGGRSVSTPTPEAIIAEAREKGEDSVDPEALAKAEMEMKLAKSKANKL